jgi:hypothetical protein
MKNDRQIKNAASEGTAEACEDTGEITNEIKGYEKKEAALGWARSTSRPAPTAGELQDCDSWDLMI